MKKHCRLDRSVCGHPTSGDSFPFGQTLYSAEGAMSSDVGFGDLAGEEAEGAVGGFGDADAWGGLDFGGTVAVVGDSDGGGG
jgi:hypothetical protein